MYNKVSMWKYRIQKIHKWKKNGDSELYKENFPKKYQMGKMQFSNRSKCPSTQLDVVIWLLSTCDCRR
jgi:hypothetical protein